MQLSNFQYELPPELIACYPLPKRSSSRLMVVNSCSGEISHRQFTDIVSYISPNDMLVFNNTRVIAARLLGHKESGGKVEMLIERMLDDHRVLAHVRASKSPKVGSYLFFKENIRFEMLQRHGDLFELKCTDSRPVLEIIDSIGQIPLPPYFHRSPEEIDKERYQTIYAQHRGSVAAPTAGLHFDDEIFSALREKGVQIGFVTLHVGAGTFAPVRTEEIANHKMHTEYLEVSLELCEKIRSVKRNGGKVIAVGTTSARSLETAARQCVGRPSVSELKSENSFVTGDNIIQSFKGDTDIFIYPGYEFRCVDALITNFHLPGSSLLMLVSAFSGHDLIMRAYKEAVEAKYRFFSYGDAMFLENLKSNIPNNQ